MDQEQPWGQGLGDAAGREAGHELEMCPPSPESQTCPDIQSPVGSRARQGILPLCSELPPGTLQLEHPTKSALEPGGCSHRQPVLESITYLGGKCYFDIQDVPASFPELSGISFAKLTPCLTKLFNKKQIKKE